MNPVYVGFDTETHLIAPGLLAPPLVVASFCTVAENGAWLALRDDALDTFEKMLDKPDFHFVIHNAPFDLAVLCVERPSLLPKVFAALDEGRIHCTRIRDMMLHNAREGLVDEAGPKTGFHLSDLVKRRFLVDISDTKDAANPDAWRLRYAELDGVPLHEWPDAAKTYAKDDAVWHLKCFWSQEAEEADMHADLGQNVLFDEPGQMRAAFALHLMAVYGVRTDEVAVQALEAELTATVNAANEKLRAAGILKGTSKKDRDTGLVGIEWTKDTKKIKALVEAALGASTPRTEPSDRFPEGQVKTDEETLRLTGHPDLLVLADVGTDAKVLNTFVPALKGIDSKGNQRALRLPSGWLLNPGWNALVSTGRTSCRAPNLQNPPRKGNVRPCFVPRPGYWYLSADYSFIELCTWAQSCIDLLGFSKMAEAIRAGMDPHVDMGTEILRAEHPSRELSYTNRTDSVWCMNSSGVTYEFVNAARKAGAKWAKDARQLAKAANFGLPGGLGAETFVAYAHATYGVDISIDEAWKLKRIWKQKWAEADPYFNHVSAIQEQAFGQKFTITLPRTGFVRGGCNFTAACNTYFQGLAARGAKEAMHAIAKACYLPDAQGSEGLYGCRPVLFLHDEFILEVPADVRAANAAAVWLTRLMRWGMEKFVPDVPIACEPALMTRWYKDAEAVYVEGQLVPWEPKVA